MDCLMMMNERHLTLSILIASCVLFGIMMTRLGLAHAFATSLCLLAFGFIMSVVVQSCIPGALSRWIVLLAVMFLTYEFSDYAGFQAAP